MFAVQLQFESRVGGDAQPQTNAITSLVGSLVRNGNLMENFLVEGETEQWTVYGIAPAKDAFQQDNFSAFVRTQMIIIKQTGLKGPRVRFLGVVAETADVCQCEASRGTFLFTTFLHKEPPVWCIACNGVVPVYRLPVSAHGEHARLLFWESSYQACDTLQMNSSAGQRFAERQLADHRSELSRLGLAVCEEIRRMTGQPSYYYLHRARARSRSEEVRRRCPICAGKWLLKEPLAGKFDFRCDQCYLLSNIAWNLR